MNDLTIYLIGFLISSIYFGVREFKHEQKQYPNLAKQYVERDIVSGMVIGFIKGFFFPITIPIDLLARLIIKLRK